MNFVLPVTEIPFDPHLACVRPGEVIGQDQRDEYPLAHQKILHQFIFILLVFGVSVYLSGVSTEAEVDQFEDRGLADAVTRFPPATGRCLVHDQIEARMKPDFPDHMTIAVGNCE